MIDKKKIEVAAALASIKDTDKGRNRENYVISALADHENGFREGYIEGANWAIKEFLQNLWKGPEIEPKPDSDIIAISKKNMPYVFCNVEIPNVEIPNWKYLMKSHNIERWCYLNDILPWEGGEG